MQIYLHANFKRKYKQLTKAQKNKFIERRNLFLSDHFNPILNNHALRGGYKGLRSINITGDLRVLYEPIGKYIALFLIIDTHGNFYQ